MVAQEITGKLYIDRVLVSPLTSNLQKHRGEGHRVLGMEDSAPVHQSSSNQLESQSFFLPHIIPFAAPNLDPAKHMWAVLKKHLEVLPTQPTTIDRLP